MSSNYPDSDYRQLHFYDEVGVIADIKSHLDTACALANIDQGKIRCLLELGPGYGRVTRALLATFTNTTIQAIDINDQLGGVKDDPRIRFLQGSFVDVLRSGKVYKADIVTLINIGGETGFDRKNVRLIQQILGKKGKIIVNGDNGGLEFQDWFTQRFECVVGPNQIDPDKFSLLGWKVYQKK